MTVYLWIMKKNQIKNVTSHFCFHAKIKTASQTNNMTIFRYTVCKKLKKEGFLKLDSIVSLGRIYFISFLINFIAFLIQFISSHFSHFHFVISHLFCTDWCSLPFSMFQALFLQVLFGWVRLYFCQQLLQQCCLFSHCHCHSNQAIFMLASELASQLILLA